MRLGFGVAALPRARRPARRRGARGRRHRVPAAVHRPHARRCSTAGTTLVFVSHDLGGRREHHRAGRLAPRRAGPGGRPGPRTCSARTARRSSTSPSSPPTPTASCASSRRRVDRRRGRACCGPSTPPTSCSCCAAPSRPPAGCASGAARGRRRRSSCCATTSTCPTTARSRSAAGSTSLPLPRGRYYLWVGVFLARGELLGWQPAAYVRGGRTRPRRRTARHRPPVTGPRRGPAGRSDRGDGAGHAAAGRRCCSSASPPASAAPPARWRPS